MKERAFEPSGAWRPAPRTPVSLPEMRQVCVRVWSKVTFSRVPPRSCRIFPLTPVCARSEIFREGRAGRGDDDDNDRVPRWLRGTFRGTTDSGETELVIRADGTATAVSLTKHMSFQGTYTNGRLRFDWGTFEVERIGDGIRTVQTNDRNNRTDYRRTGN